MNIEVKDRVEVSAYRRIPSRLIKQLWFPSSFHRRNILFLSDGTASTRIPSEDTTPDHRTYERSRSPRWTKIGTASDIRFVDYGLNRHLHRRLATGPWSRDRLTQSMQGLGIPYFVSELSRVTAQGVCLVFPSTSIEKNAEARNSWHVYGYRAVKFEGSRRCVWVTTETQQSKKVTYTLTSEGLETRLIYRQFEKGRRSWTYSNLIRYWTTHISVIVHESNEGIAYHWSSWTKPSMPNQWSLGWGSYHRQDLWYFHRHWAPLAVWIAWMGWARSERRSSLRNNIWDTDMSWGMFESSMGLMTKPTVSPREREWTLLERDIPMWFLATSGGTNDVWRCSTGQ